MSLSVIIPTYNNPRSLTLALEGWAYQSFKDFEVIVVNDGGEDDPTAEVVEEFVGRLEIQYHYLNPKTTTYRLAAARNMGIHYSSGRRVYMSDDDCVPAVNVAEEIYKYWTDQNKIVATNIKWLNTPDLHRITRYNLKEELPKWSHWGGNQRLENLPIDFKCEIHTMDRFDPRIGRTYYTWEQAWGSSVSYPKTPVDMLGGYWEEFEVYGGEDGELARRLVNFCGCQVVIRPDLMVYHINKEDKTGDCEPNAEIISRLFEESEKAKSPIRNSVALSARIYTDGYHKFMGDATRNQE